jgi:hypothetical protein
MKDHRIAKSIRKSMKKITAKRSRPQPKQLTQVQLLRLKWENEESTNFVLNQRGWKEEQGRVIYVGVEEAMEE